MPEIVTHSDRFNEVFVQAQRATDSSRDLGYFERVSESGPIVIPRRIDKDLSLVLQSAKALCVDDSIAVPLKRGTDRRRIFLNSPAGINTPHGERRKKEFLSLHEARLNG
jgi:hypothetical protein